MLRINTTFSMVYFSLLYLHVHRTIIIIISLHMHCSALEATNCSSRSYTHLVQDLIHNRPPLRPQ